MNLRDLPDFNDLYAQFTAEHDYDKSFTSWWNAVEESFEDILDKRSADWLKPLLRCFWEQSPMAHRIVDDLFFDEIRRWRDRVVA